MQNRKAAMSRSICVAMVMVNVEAFVVPGGQGLGRIKSAVYSKIVQSDADRIKSVGCGIPLVDELFDPELEGKMQGTGSLSERIAAGTKYVMPPIITSDPPNDVQQAQHWLEDIGVPVNFAKNTAPTTATVLGSARAIGEDAPGDIRHIVMELPDGMHYVEGQSLSVIPPGTDPSTGKTHKPRLYSIASTRYGDLLDGRTVSLCVRRAEYVDPTTGKIDPSKAGVCSHFLCDAPPGTVVDVAGPVGKTMLLPESPDADIIMIATGTGIAPFRGFLHRLFMEQTVTRHMFNGNAWLVLGVPTTSGLLYTQEIDTMKRNANGQLRVDYAISREMKNSIDGGKMYVQHVMAQNADLLFQKLESGNAHVYFCGLKGMMPPILETLDAVAQQKRGKSFTKDILPTLKANHQWHVEVY